jgi:hypothetical protein
MSRMFQPGRTRLAFASSVAVVFLPLAACDAGPALGPSDVDLAQMGKVELCHRTSAGDYVRISVADVAYSTHMSHGDQAIGDPVPGLPGFVFDHECRPMSGEGPPDIEDLCTDQLIDDDRFLCVPEGVSYTLTGPRQYEAAWILGELTTPAFAALVIDAGEIRVGPNGRIDAAGTGRAGGLPNAVSSLGGHMAAGDGGACGGGPGASVGQGGSGAGHGGAGGLPSAGSMWQQPCDVCDVPSVYHCVGNVGAAFGQAAGTGLAFGGGGSAAGHSMTCTDAGRGGQGGGAILLLGGSVHIDGQVVADGEKPPASESQTDNCYRPGGGGGAGGTVMIIADHLSGAGLISARGGAGGDSPGAATASFQGTWAWAGGGGGGGRVRLYHPGGAFTGTIQVDGGAGGEVPATESSYAGAPGSAGSMFQSQVIPDHGFDTLF